MDQPTNQLGQQLDLPLNNEIIRTPYPPSFPLEQTTVWSFPERGKWATHAPDYRGNFAPQVARNIILTYSAEGETILDPMVGSGTTLIETRLLNRHGLGYDINPQAVAITQARLAFNVDNDSQQQVSVGDVRQLDRLADESIDLILTHPPYADIITYSDRQIEADLSSIRKIDTFLDALQLGLSEMYRVLHPNRYCAILMGDTRKGQHYIPLSFMVLRRALAVGFVLKEQIIKVQHNTRQTGRWRGAAQAHKFYLIMHEHLFVFRKPASDENVSRLRYSSGVGL